VPLQLPQKEPHFEISEKKRPIEPPEFFEWLDGSDDCIIRPAKGSTSTGRK
jgi:hypothetical protein